MKATLDKINSHLRESVVCRSWFLIDCSAIEFDFIKMAKKKVYTQLSQTIG